MNIASELARAGRDFFRRGWVLGTSGNFSAIRSRQHFRIAITPSGSSNGALHAQDFLHTHPGQPAPPPADDQAQAAAHNPKRRG